jgi:hypothetical protein
MLQRVVIPKSGGLVAVVFDQRIRFPGGMAIQFGRDRRLDRLVLDPFPAGSVASSPTGDKFAIVKG